MEGRIVQVGTPQGIFGRPSHAAVAGFIGTPPMNLLPAHWSGSAVRVGDRGQVDVGSTAPGEREVTLGVRPGDLKIVPSGLAAEVELVEELGDSRIAVLHVGDQRVKLKTDSPIDLREGQAVHLGFAAKAAHLFDRSSGERLN